MDRHYDSVKFALYGPPQPPVDSRERVPVAVVRTLAPRSE